MNLSFTGQKQSSVLQPRDMCDVSLICEEDLLTTIFHACDIKHTGLLVPFVAVFQFPLKLLKLRSRYSLGHGNL